MRTETKCSVHYLFHNYIFLKFPAGLSFPLDCQDELFVFVGTATKEDKGPSSATPCLKVPPFHVDKLEYFTSNQVIKA